MVMIRCSKEFKSLIASIQLEFLKEGKKNEWDSKLFYGLNTWIISENKLWTVYLGGKESNNRSAGLASMNFPKIM